MTRFARAKGSKSSNLKSPDDSTPWEVMKEQLLQAKKESEENKNRQQAESQRIENYSNFLKEQKVLKRKATWCDFPEAKGKKAKNDEKKVIKNKNKKTGAVAFNVEQTQVASNVGEVTNHANDDIKIPLKKKKRNKHKIENVSPESESHTEETNKIEQELPKQGKNKKNNKKNQNIATNNTTSEAVITEASSNKQVNNTQKTKANKKKDGNHKRRKEINDRSFQLIINGKEVELMRFDGFPIMKKDAERLSELKSNMVKKGIPKTEVNRTIKLERRRAEKALARLKRDVCYNCRKGGHNLSDCPDLRSNIPGVEAADGVCFKCGSTEHRQFECKVQRDKEFRFASCFICKEQGHIARQCPDNPKGLYPNGGSCKLCGDVTHLRKDCPTDQNKKEGTSIKLHTLDTGDNIEDIELQSKPQVSQEPPKKPKKIKF